ncbi:MAG TPA: hypothetical protein VGC21_18600 [Telluria sp.]|jgi:hypothetical protein
MPTRQSLPSKTPLTLGSSVALVFLLTLAILMLPLTAMQFTDEVVWTLSDFLVAAVLLVSTGLLYVALFRLVRDRLYRSILGALLGLAFFLMWAELAVGLFGTRFAGS